MSKRIVALSWTLPPIVLPRSIQVSRLLAELDGRGWTSTVLTAPVVSNDPTIPRDTVLAAHYAGRYRQIEIEYREAEERSPWLMRLSRTLRRVKELDDLNWVARASTAALRELNSDDDVFVTFAQPWIDHVAGLRVKVARPRQPWIAHFSDPWVDSLYYDGADPAQAARLAIWREQERAVIAQADAIAFVTRETADLVMRKYPEDWRGKVHILPHSFDRSLISKVVKSGAPQAGDRPLRVVYTGNIYAGRREPLPLFDALARLDRSGALRGRLSFAFYGHIPPTTINGASERGLDGFVSFHGPVTYMESLSLMAQADALLLIDANADVNVFLPSKIADYLMIDRPILGLTPVRGATADVLRRSSHMVVDPTDQTAIEAALVGLIDADAAGRPETPSSAQATSEFEVGAVASRFEAMIEAARSRVRS